MRKTLRVVLKTLFLQVFALVFILSLAHPLARAEETPPAETQPAETPSPSGSADEQRSALEQQLAELEKEIEENQKTIETYQKQGNTLKNEIQTLNAKISKLNLQIKAISLSLTKLNQDINETQRQINQTENQIDKRKLALAYTIRSIHDTDRKGIVEILLENDRLSEFFGSLNDLALVQQSLRTDLVAITKLRQDFLAQKEELSQEKSDAENLRAIQQNQKQGVEGVQRQKSDILKVTKGKESEYQKLLVKTRATAAQIRTRIFELLGGGELTFEKAYDYARLAEGATGVRAALILAILQRESLLGKNVGRCSYTTAMNPTRDVPYFLDLLKRLNIDPDSEFAKVSCPNQHGTYGGAMGPAQFIPSTWKLYESKIAAVTDNNPPSPWNNADAFSATAVYVKDLINSASCQQYGEQNKNLADKQTLIERCAAAKYYAGSSWYTYRFWYGEPVIVKANEYEEDIRVLKGGVSFLFEGPLSLFPKLF